MQTVHFVGDVVFDTREEVVRVPVFLDLNQKIIHVDESEVPDWIDAADIYAGKFTVVEPEQVVL